MKSKIGAILIFSIALTACTSMPLSTMWKLRDVNPLEADPGQFKIAVITNELIQLKDDSTSIGIGFSTDDVKHSFDTIVNASVKPNAREAQLEPFRKASERITLFNLNAEAAQQLRVAQSRIQTIKDKDINGEGSFTVGINTACIDAPKPKSVNANIFISFEPSQGYIKLVSNIDLLAESQGDEQGFWVECD